MATTPLPQDFADFLKLLNSHGVEFLLIGGYAVGIHGYPRGTADLDVWVSTAQGNAARIVSALKDFGFETPELSAALFQQPDKVVRMGVPPIRIDILTSIAGVTFEDCYRRREVVSVGDLQVPVISLPDLKVNKLATGRNQDRADVDHLP
jgi:predicted nucleotidyltransferase